MVASVLTLTRSIRAKEKAPKDVAVPEASPKFRTLRESLPQIAVKSRRRFGEQISFA